MRLKTSTDCLEITSEYNSLVQNNYTVFHNKWNIGRIEHFVENKIHKEYCPYEDHEISTSFIGRER